MGSSVGKMAAQALRLVLAAVLVLGCAPALTGAAWAAEADAGAGSSFAATDDPNVAQAETTVYLKAQSSALRMIDWLKAATSDDLSAGLWVQVAGGTAPYSAQWRSVQVDAGGNAIAGTERAWGAGEAFDKDSSSFTLKLAASQLADGARYHFWCDVTDSSPAHATVSNPDPIVVVCASGYGPGPKEWTAEGDAHWTWRLEGAMNGSDGQPNGVDGKLLNASVLSASDIASISTAERLAAAAAAEGGKVVSSYNVALVSLTDPQDAKDAFIGDILVKFDVTDIVAQGTPAQDLGLFWLNPYEAGGSLVDIFASPYDAKVRTEDGRTYIAFTFSGADAGPSGVLGSFALTAPAAQMFAITMEATEGGRVDPCGTLERPQGDMPQFMLYQDFGYAIDAVVAVSASGAESPAAGTLEGNTFTLDPLSADMSLRAKFKKVQAPQPGPAAMRAVELVAGAADADRKTSVSIVGCDGSEVAAGSSKSGLKVDASRPVTLAFNTAQGFAVDAVSVTYTADGDGVSAGAAQRYQAEGAYLELPVLLADARIEVSYKPVIVEPMAPIYNVSATAAPARAASASAVPAQVESGDAATFAAAPKLGWKLVRAEVLYLIEPAGASAPQQVSGPVYEAAALPGASLTIYGVVSDTRVDFIFEKDVKEIAFPAPGSVAGASVSLDGSHAVDVEAPLEFTVTTAPGYTLPPSGLMLAGSDRERVIGWTGAPVQNADGSTTYRVTITYADAADLGEDIKLSVRPQRGSDVPDQERYTVTTSAGEGGRITASTTVDAGQSVTIWFFPDAAHRLSGVTVDGAPLEAFAGAEEIFDHTGDAKPCITIRSIAADHAVHATFVEDAGAEVPPSVVIKPDPGDLPENPDPDNPNPDRPPFEEGGSNVGGETPVYKGEDQSFIYTPRPGYVLDAVLVDGEYLYFDGAHLKDDLAIGDHKLFSWDEERGCYVFKDGEGETVEFDIENGVLTFRNVQKSHTYLFAETPVVDVVLNVDAVGGSVRAEGMVEGSMKVLSWKMRKGLPIYMIPDVESGYRLGDVLLDGVPVLAEEIREATGEALNVEGSASLSSLVKVMTLADEAYAAEPVVYAYTLPSKYLYAKEPGSVVTVTVPFKKDASGDDGNGGNGNGNGDGNGGNGSGDGSGDGAGDGNGNGNGSGSGNGSQGSVIPGISNGFNGSTSGDGSAQNPNGTFTIKAAVKSGQGTLDCPAEQQVQPGAACTVAFRPAVGYQVVALHIDGTRYAYTNRTFTFQNVRAGHTVEAEFAVVGYAGDNSQTARLVKTLQSLAQTGDLNAPAATALLAVAFGATGIAFLAWNRRRKEEEAS